MANTIFLKNRRVANLFSAAAITALLAAPMTASAEERTYRISAQPLSTALLAFGEASGLTLLFDPSLASGKSSAGVSGRMSQDDGLTRLLAGSGVRYSFIDEKTVQLSPISQTLNDGSIVLNEIVVQGELQSRRLQETQTSVFVATGRDIEERSDDSIEEIFNRAANVSTGFNGGDVIIRGISERGVSAGGTPLITTTIDGARVSNSQRRTTTFYSTFDLQQVEVLRGPQSTQTGRNALAGAVVVRSNDPSYDFEGKLRGGYGTQDTGEIAAMVNIPLVDDTLALRIVADHDRSDRFTDNPTLGINDADRERRTTLRAGLRFDPTDDIEMIGKFTYFDAFDTFNDIQAATFPDERLNLNNVQDRVDTRHLAGNFRIGWDINDALRFESETNYLDLDLDLVIDPDDSPADFGTSFVDNNGRTFEQEIKLLYEGEDIRAVIGGFFTDTREFDEINAVVPASILSPLAPPGTFVSGIIVADRNDENFALFGEVEYDLTDQITLIAGARYDREKVRDISSTTATASNPALQPFLPPNTLQENSGTFDAILPKAGIVYNFTDDMSLGFTYQRGFRSGGVSTNLATGLTNEFDPEFTDNFEVSFRSQWMDGNLTVNANAFYTDWKDQQVAVAGPLNNGLDFITVNAGESRYFGGEVEVRAQPIDGLDVFGSVGFVDTKFTEFVNGGVDFSGNQFIQSPKWTIAFGGSYEFENGFFVGGDANYRSVFFSEASNNPVLRTDDRFLVNVRAGYREKNWEIMAYVDNLFDVDYVNNARGAGTATTQTLIAAGDGLSAGIIAQLKF